MQAQGQKSAKKQIKRILASECHAASKHLFQFKKYKGKGAWNKAPLERLGTQCNRKERNPHERNAEVNCDLEDCLFQATPCMRETTTCIAAKQITQRPTLNLHHNQNNYQN